MARKARFTDFVPMQAELRQTKARISELEAEVERLRESREYWQRTANIWSRRAEAFEALSRTGAVKVTDALEAIKDAILRADPNVLTDTFWMPDDVFKGGTVVDFIDHALSTLEPAAPEGEQDDGHTDTDGYPYEFTRPAEQVATEEWREIKQQVQPRITDGYTAVAISKPGYWFVKGPGPAAALKAAMEAGR